MGELIPPEFKHLLSENANLCTIPFPRTLLKSNHPDKYLNASKSKLIYKACINDKVKLPVGMLRWCQNHFLSDNQ